MLTHTHCSQDNKLFLTWRTKTGPEGFALNRIAEVTSDNDGDTHMQQETQTHTEQQEVSTAESSNHDRAHTDNDIDDASSDGVLVELPCRASFSMSVHGIPRELVSFVASQSECSVWVDMLTALIAKERGVCLQLQDQDTSDQQQQQQQQLQVPNAATTLNRSHAAG